MKTIFKTIVLSIGCIITTNSVFGQLPTNPQALYASKMETANSDYVTVGSLVPYFVEPDNSINTMAGSGIMKNSIFQWTTTSSDPILNYDGAVAPTFNALRTGAGSFYENEIGIKWATIGSYTVSVAEQSVTKSASITGCLGNTQTKPVFVLAHPTVAFTATEGGGCISSTSTVNVPVSVKGIGDWVVSYTVSYNGVTGTLATKTITATNPTVNDGNVISTSTTPTSGTLDVVLNGTLGYCVVTISDVSDRISRKALNFNDLTVSPASGTYTIYINPRPTTQSIQKLKNQ